MYEYKSTNSLKEQTSKKTEKQYYTKILEVNLFAFAYRLFHEDFSSIDGALLLPIEHSTTCDSRIYEKQYYIFCVLYLSM